MNEDMKDMILKNIEKYVEEDEVCNIVNDHDNVSCDFIDIVSNKKVNIDNYNEYDIFEIINAHDEKIKKENMQIFHETEDVKIDIDTKTDEISIKDILRFIFKIILAISIIYMGKVAYDEISEAKLKNQMIEDFNKYDDLTVITQYKELEPAEIEKIESEPNLVMTNTASEAPEKIESENIKREMTMQMKYFHDINEDTAGWLKIDNTKINNIVVQTDDNEYYLDHNFNKEKSQPGTLFIDYRCNENSDNIIIYGHKQKSGSMFGTLHYYHNNFEFYKNNPVFEFSDLYENHKYKIIAMFACATENEEDIFDYHNYIEFDDENYRFQDWVINIKKHTEIYTTVDMQPDDKYITLSTCSYEKPGYRFVVIARQIRENEDETVDINNAIKAER